MRNLDQAMRDITLKLSVERATPHDLRRTHGSTITALGFGRDAMNRIQNHREGGIARSTTATTMRTRTSTSWKRSRRKIMALVEATDDTVIPRPFRRALSLGLAVGLQAH